MVWPYKGPFKYNTSRGSTFNPATATPDAVFPFSTSTTGIRISGSATITPYVYISDSGNNRIKVTDFDLNFLFAFGSYGSGDGELSSPYGVCNDGEFVYVTDSGNHRIQKFTLAGAYVSQWGSYGNGEGQFSAPKGIVVNERFVFVVDQGNNRFQVFTKDGVFIMAYGEYGLGADPQYLNAPTRCEVDPYYLYIDDTGNGYVKWYLLTQFGDYGSVVLPVMTINGQGGWPSGRGNVVLPALTLSTEGATGSVMRVGSGNVILPAITVSGNGYAWHLGIGDVVLPVLRISANGVPGRIGIGAVVLPVLTTAGSGYAWHVGTGSITLPAILVSANGYLVLASPEFAGLAMNMRNKAITTYSGYNFNSLAILSGILYGANEDGIFPLSGTDDLGVAIAAHIKTGTVDLHDPHVTRIEDAWLTGRLSGAGLFTVFEGEETEGSAEDVIVDDSEMHNERVKLPQGLKNRFASFQFENVEGSDFDLTGMNVKTRDIAHRKR